jgi:hypothetical protein
MSFSTQGMIAQTNTGWEPGVAQCAMVNTAEWVDLGSLSDSFEPWYSSKRQIGAAEFVAQTLRFWASEVGNAFRQPEAPIAILGEFLAQWKARRRLRNLSSKKAGKNSGLNGLSAFRRIAARVKFDAGFFGTHKVDARNIP